MMNCFLLLIFLLRPLEAFGIKNQRAPESEILTIGQSCWEEWNIKDLKIPSFIKAPYWYLSNHDCHILSLSILLDYLAEIPYNHMNKCDLGAVEISSLNSATLVTMWPWAGYNFPCLIFLIYINKDNNNCCSLRGKNL